MSYGRLFATPPPVRAAPEYNAGLTLRLTVAHETRLLDGSRRGRHSRVGIDTWSSDG
jgi:hypothetical protein